ncbi:hypothetical protein ASPSYDRAFT_610823 [Aspergillus sydowii CBS 593.65]|uniref:Uncharacterized protein n=1 Tax=Aspergillus sydowii CBS 593.65 TaxID=1036612 RepID=A0A1L9TRK7_9EURO|nr:uncharacterized protein ASPSYDRAFT_610823 [Aspergillus sydowii CBS 593.65]OJJ62070.1 hypothetical protein ASPSYDRAFT_610823 [Aspergillus sydowii CBS 593.65]
MPANGYHPVELRVQILTLYGLGFKTLDIASYLEVAPRTIQDLIKKAKARGYKPEESLRVKKEYFEDSKRSGRPKEITPAIESSILQSISKDRAGREKSSEILAFEAGISSSSVLRILHSYGLNNAKPSTKPGLTDAMKAKRLEYCLQNPWTNDSIKDLIFTDETAVVLGQRRGAVRVWRTPEDQYNQTCIRRRWKGCSEFMEVLIPYLIPFAKRCKEARPNTRVLEDKAPAHRHHAQQRVYDYYGIQRIDDWPGNSPDLNAIEPCWSWLKKHNPLRGGQRVSRRLRYTQLERL